mgnify:CR=1 FL=1
MTSIPNHAFADCTALTNVTPGRGITSIGEGAFADCTGLTGAYFQGNAPGAGEIVFSGASKVTIYHLPGTSGWGPTYEGRPTALWRSPLLSSGVVQANGKGFALMISWAPKVGSVVEACSDPASRAWLPVGTNAPSTGSWDFSDPDWKGQPARFYRVQGQ